MSQAEQIQIEILKKMSPTEKIRISEQMYWTAWELKTQWLKKIHPDWTEKQVEEKVREIFTFARS